MNLWIPSVCICLVAVACFGVGVFVGKENGENSAKTRFCNPICATHCSESKSHSTDSFYIEGNGSKLCKCSCEALVPVK